MGIFNARSYESYFIFEKKREKKWETSTVRAQLEASSSSGANNTTRAEHMRESRIEFPWRSSCRAFYVLGLIFPCTVIHRFLFLWLTDDAIRIYSIMHESCALGVLV